MAGALKRLRIERRRVLLGAAAFAVSLSACQPLPPVSVEATSFDFATDAPERVCAGNLSGLDAFVTEVSSLLAVDPERFTIYWLTEGPLDELGVCSSGPLACFNRKDGAVYTSFLPGAHEVSHAVIAGWEAHSSLEEGLAHLLEEPVPSSQEPAPEVSLDDLLGYDGDTADFPQELRGRSSHFVRFLLDRHGSERVGALLRASRRGVDLRSTSQIFDDALGESLGEIREAYDAAPLCPLVEARLAVVECAARPIQPRVDLSGWDALVTVGCEAPDARGDGGGTHWIPRTFEVLAPGSYELAVAADPADGAELVLGRCGGRCGGVYQRLVAGEVLTVELDEGWHYLLFVRRDGLPGDVALTITTVEDRRGEGAGAR